MHDEPISFNSKTQAWMFVKFIVGITINSSGTNQPSTKQHIFTKMPVKCLFMVWLSKLKLL